jgi:hypothetical protein
LSIILGYRAERSPSAEKHPAAALTIADALRRWSISSQSLPSKRDPLADPLCGEYPLSKEDLANSKSFILLRRPSDGRCVAVVEVSSDGSVVLNPRSTVFPKNPFRKYCWDYGPIPILAEMSISQADHLWGETGKSESNDVKRTYRLKTFNSPKDPDFFLDLIFKNDYVEKYRLRSSELKGASSWLNAH